MWASVIYSVAYIAFNIAFFFLETDEEERVIYGILDWGENAGKAALIALGIIVVLVPVFGLLHYGVFRCVYALGMFFCCCMPPSSTVHPISVLFVDITQG